MIVTRDYPGQGPTEVQNNVWVVGGDNEVVVVDASHDVGPIVDAVAGRRVTAIACTHGHWDHVDAAFDLGDAVDARSCCILPTRPSGSAPGRIAHPIVTSLRETCSWPTASSSGYSTPRDTPLGASASITPRATICSTATLFPGGPGSTDDELGDFEVIIASIRERILIMPPETAVHLGHGDPTMWARRPCTCPSGSRAAGSPAWTR